MHFLQNVVDYSPKKKEGAPRCPLRGAPGKARAVHTRPFAVGVCAASGRNGGRLDSTLPNPGAPRRPAGRAFLINGNRTAAFISG